MRNRIKTFKEKARIEALLPGGLPRYVRCYDNGGKTADRYTVVFTNLKSRESKRTYPALSLSYYCFHPSIGVAQWVFGSYSAVDRPAYAHLGKRIDFDELPEDPKKYVLECYKQLWELF